MAEQRGEPREGYEIEYPNREKAASKATKAIVVLLLLVSAGLVLLISIGGWDKLQGGRFVQLAFVPLFLGFAFLIWRWSRGLLPVAAAFATILLIFAVVSAPAWFERDKDGFTSPAIDESVIGLLVFLLALVQLLLIIFALRGFSQGWHVEVEHAVDGHRDDDAPRRGGPQPQPA